MMLTMAMIFVWVALLAILQGNPRELNGGQIAIALVCVLFGLLMDLRVNRLEERVTELMKPTPPPSRIFTTDWAENWRKQR